MTTRFKNPAPDFTTVVAFVSKFMNAILLCLQILPLIDLWGFALAHLQRFYEAFLNKDDNGLYFLVLGIGSLFEFHAKLLQKLLIVFVEFLPVSGSCEFRNIVRHTRASLMADIISLGCCLAT